MVGLVLVVHLRRGLSKLQLLLGQCDTLRHREDVGIRDRDDVDPVIKILREDLRPTLHIVRIGVNALSDGPCQEFQLLLLGIVQPLVDRAQHTAPPLQQSDGRTDRHLLIGVRHAKIGGSNKLFRRRNAETKQLHKDCAGFLVGKGQQTVPQASTGGVNVAPLARLQERALILDAQTLGLEPRRQIRQRSCVDQLAKDRGRASRQVSDEVNQTKPVETKAGHELVVDEVLALALLGVFLVVIPTDRQHITGIHVDCDDVGQLYARRIPVIVHILQPF